MSEQLIQGSVDSFEVLKSCELRQMPSGDILYVSSRYTANPYNNLPDEPFKLLVSSQGQQFAGRRDFINLIDLSTIPPIGKEIYRGHHGFVTKEKIRKYLGLKTEVKVAVKRIYVQCLTGISGFDYFQAMNDLIDLDFNCATPLLATRDRFVSQWVDGISAVSVKGGDQQLQDFDFTNVLVSTAKSLKESGKWPGKWKIDTFNNNFFIRNPNATNPKDRYTLIDPIYT